MPEPRLRVEDIDVRFGGVRALAAVGLAVPPGAVTGLIGPNGAGKTTLFNVVTGLQRPDRGRVHLDARDITGVAPHRRAAAGLGRTFQRLELFGSLTVRENILMAAETRGGRKGAAQHCGALMEQVGIAAVAEEPADLVPTGTARLVELARALACRPSVLLLDEPSSGLDRDETERLGQLLGGLAAEGMAVLLVEHDMTLVMEVCSRVTVLDFGRVIAEGPAPEIRDDPVVQAAYLGEPDRREDRPRGRGGAAADPGPAPTQPVRTGPASAGPAGADGPPAPPAATGLELRDVRAGYGRIEVVGGVSLSVPGGTLVALLGPNGAGKSTLLKVASGRLAPTSGSVHLGGVDVTGTGAARLAHLGLCTIPEGRPVFPNLTVGENVRMFTYRSRSLRREQVEERSYERFPVLGQRRRQLAGTLSGGEQQMLAIARALTTDPRVLVVDEPSMGLAPMIVDQLYEAIAALARSEELAVLVVEQFAESALAIADRAAVMINGRIEMEGSPAEVEAAVVGAYMGAAPA